MVKTRRYDFGMNLDVVAREILEGLSKKRDRKKVSLYLSESKYQELQRNVTHWNRQRKGVVEISPSQVIEELIERFNKSFT